MLENLVSDNLFCLSVGDDSFLFLYLTGFCLVTQATYNSLTISPFCRGLFDVESMFFSFVLCGFVLCLFSFFVFLFMCVAMRQMRVAGVCRL